MSFLVFCINSFISFFSSVFFCLLFCLLVSFILLHLDLQVNSVDDVCLQATASLVLSSQELGVLPYTSAPRPYFEPLHPSMIPGESIAVLKDYILSILTQLNDCNSHIAALERTAHKLTPNGKLDTKGQEIPHINDKRLFIERLEQQRFTLLMDIQRQDYVTLQLQAILQHNLDLLKNVQEYLENSTRVRHEEAQFSKLLMDGYKKNVSLKVSGKLDENLESMKHGIHKIEATLVLINEAIQKENEALASGEFEAKLNGLITELNIVLQKLE